MLTIGITVLGCGAGTAALLSYVKFLFFPGGFCSEAAAQFSQDLTTNTLTGQPTEGMVAIDSHVFQPCEGRGSSNDGGLAMAWTYPADLISDDEITAYYRRLGTETGWQLFDYSTAEGLYGYDEIDGTCVRFNLTLPSYQGREGRGYPISLTYPVLGRQCAS